MLWGNVCNRLLQVNAAIARGLTCCKILARHRTLRKIWSTKFPLGRGWGKPYLASGLIVYMGQHMRIRNLTIDILMDLPIQINTMKIGVATIYYKGSQVEISKLLCISVPEDFIVHALSWHFILVFTVCQSTPLRVSNIQRVNAYLQNGFLIMHLQLSNRAILVFKF